MAWMITCDDGPNGASMRKDQALMDEMWAYELATKDKVLAAGSLRTDDGKIPTGSLVIYNTQTKDQALELFNNDPATKAGMRVNINIRYWNPAILDTQVQE